MCRFFVFVLWFSEFIRPARPGDPQPGGRIAAPSSIWPSHRAASARAVPRRSGWPTRRRRGVDHARGQGSSLARSMAHAFTDLSASILKWLEPAIIRKLAFGR